jgi:uncharacterized repeat protein (TIGR01451 family)
MVMEPDPLMPGWPICTVLKERTYLHIVACELGVLRPDQSTRVQVVLTADGVRERSIVNSASVSANEADLSPMDNTDVMTIPVQVRADLSVRSVITEPEIADEMLSFTLAVANLGPSDANVVLTDTLPPGTAFASAIPSQGSSCQVERDDGSGDAVVCRLGRLKGGETAAVTIVIADDRSRTSTEAVVHTATVAAEQADPDPSNNTLTESIPLSGGVED